MKILFLTSTFQNREMLEANSLINIVLTLMRGMWELRPDWRFTWAVNLRDVDTALYLQNRINDPRCRVVYIGCDYGTAERIDILSGSAAKILAQSRAEVFYDVAISAHPLLLPYFVNVSMDAYDIGMWQRIPTLAWFAQVNAKPYSEQARPAKLSEYGIMDLMASITADAVVTLSLHAKRMLYDVTKRYFNSGVVRHIADRTQIISPAIDFAELDNRMHLRSIGDSPVLFSTDQLTTRKRAKEVFQLYQKVALLRSDARIVMQTIMKRPTWLSEGEYIQFSRPERSAYYDGLFAGDVFVCASTVEMFGLCNIEQIYAGQIGVFVAAPWQESTLPSDYPFIANDFEEALATVLWVIDNLQEAREMVVPVREWFKEQYNRKSQAAAFVAIFERIDRDSLDRVKLERGLAGLVKTVAFAWEGGTLDNFMVRLCNRSEKKLGDNRKFYVRRCLRALGYEENAEEKLCQTTANQR